LKRPCPNCNNVALVRTHRRGFLQEHLLPKLGLYPWECQICRQIFLQKSRGHHSRRTLQGELSR